MHLLKIIYLASIVSAQILLSQSLNDAELTQLDGWQVVNGLGQFSIENGLSILGGIGNFNQNTVLLKLMTTPPHYQLRVELKLWAYNKWNDTELQIFIDKQLIAGQKVYSMHNDNFKTTYNINVVNVHNHPTFLLTIKTSKNNQTLDLSWGIRDLKISYYSCPQGCSICQAGDILEVCQQWVKYYHHFAQMSTELFTNEGWKIKGGNELFKYQSCLGTPLFGFIHQGQQLERQFYLDSHYRIKIQFFFFKIDNWRNIKARLYVDYKNVWTYQFDDLDDSTYYNICQSSDEFDDFVKVELTFDHSEQFTNLYFMTDYFHPRITVFGIRDFALYIIPCPSGCKLCNYDKCLSVDNYITLQTSEQFFTDEQFVSNSGWALQKIQDLSNLISKCAGKSIFGGYNRLGRGQDGQPIYSQKTYLLSAHRMIKFIITFYIIDSMDGVGLHGPDRVYITIDDEEVYNKYFGTSIWLYAGENDLCGPGNSNSNWSDSIEPPNETIIIHSSRYVTVKIWSDCGELPDNESFGFRDIQLYTGDCDFDCNSCSTDSGNACEVIWNLEYRELFQDTFDDAQGWGNPQTITPQKIISDCGGFSVLGGDYSMNYDSSISTTVILTDHTKIRIELKIFLIGNWNGESIYLFIDGKIIYSQKIYPTYFNRLCDTNLVSTAIQIDEIIQHSSPAMKIEIKSNLRIDSSPDCGFGVRDVIIKQNFI